MTNRFSLWLEEHRELGILIGVLACSLLLLSTLGVYLFLESRSNFHKAEELQFQLNSVRRFQQQIDFSVKKGEMTNVLQGLEDRLPAQVDMNQLVLQINSLAATGNITIDSLETLDGKNEYNEKFKCRKIRISCGGECQNLLDFMKNVEGNENLMLFDEVIMEAGDNNRVSLKGIINVFYR